jgi:hypothetical protein
VATGVEGLIGRVLVDKPTWRRAYFSTDPSESAADILGTITARLLESDMVTLWKA